ncbi:MAG: class I SAM-dependent methyltransferase [Planctomycetota bacterium]|nr:MAG: class I SAM-dependent methyltransferase [Planctomycetota bacterium]REK46691.1 MAG: class I SAM-dependent methyltransferase [Planctomycetota bacterium]
MPRLFTRSLLVLLLLAMLGGATFLARPLTAEDAEGDGDDAIPPGPKVYMGREIAQTMHYAGAPWLIRESREREEECSTLLEQFDIQPGQIICDMGSGNGFYTLKMAAQLEGQGQVLAVDIQPEMLRLLQARARAEELDCGDVVLEPPADRDYGEALIVPIIGSLVDPYLPEGKVDLCICVDVYHEFSHPEQMLAAIRKSLAPQGRLVLVEFRSEDPNVPIKPLHKMSKAQVLKELLPNGFKLVEQYDELPWQHVMFFERDEAWQPEAATAAENSSDDSSDE